MAQSRKTALAADGMAGLQMMPFPALNPWNWWALARPNVATRTALYGASAALQAWRIGADGMRAVVRAQQDSLLAMWAPSETPNEPDAAKDRADHGAAKEESDAPPASTFVAPMLEATRVYGRIGKAFIVAQRDTMRAFTEAGKPH
jgi:hypothetical protein